MSRRREIIGVMLMALTASTVFTLFVAVERSDRPIEILENSYPPVLRHDLRNTFSLGIIARKPIQILETETAFLSSLQLEDMGINIPEQGRAGMLQLQAVSNLLQMAEQVGVSPIEFEVEDFKRGQNLYDVHILDFTELLKPLVNDTILSGYQGMGLSVIYAGLFNETGLMFLYGGSKDFFPRRNISITELSISRNDDKDVYKRVKELSPTEISQGVPTLLDAPAGGVLAFEDLEKDDTVRLAFSVDRSTIRGLDTLLKISHADKLEMIKISSNAEVEELILNWVLAG